MFSKRMQSTVQSVLNMKELRSTHSKGLEVPCQVFPFMYGLFLSEDLKKLGNILGSHQVWLYYMVLFSLNDMHAQTPTTTD